MPPRPKRKLAEVAHEQPRSDLRLKTNETQSMPAEPKPNPNAKTPFKQAKIKLTQEAIEKYLPVQSVQKMKVCLKSDGGSSAQSGHTTYPPGFKFEPDIRSVEELNRHIERALNRMALRFPLRKLIDFRICKGESGSSLSASSVTPDKIMPQLLWKNLIFQNREFRSILKKLLKEVGVSQSQLNKMFKKLLAKKKLMESINSKFDAMRVIKKESVIATALNSILDSVLSNIVGEAYVHVPDSEVPLAVAGACAYADPKSGEYVPLSYICGIADIVYRALDESEFCVVETKLDRDDVTVQDPEGLEPHPKRRKKEAATTLAKPWFLCSTALAQIICYLFGSITARLGIVLTNKGFIVKLKEEVDPADVDNRSGVMQDGDKAFKYYMLSDNGRFLKINSLVENPSDEEREEIMQNRMNLLKLLFLCRIKAYDSDEFEDLMRAYPDTDQEDGQEAPPSEDEDPFPDDPDWQDNEQFGFRDSNAHQQGGDSKLDGAHKPSSNPAPGSKPAHSSQGLVDTEEGVKMVYHAAIGYKNRSYMRMATVQNLPTLESVSSVDDVESVSSFDAFFDGTSETDRPVKIPPGQQAPTLRVPRGA